MIADYELTERIGRGGMGEVWHARHRMPGRAAAVKLIRPEAPGKTEVSCRCVFGGVDVEIKPRPGEGRGRKKLPSP